MVSTTISFKVTCALLQCMVGLCMLHEEEHMRPPSLALNTARLFWHIRKEISQALLPVLHSKNTTVAKQIEKQQSTTTQSAVLL